jgi:hypothetical protein
MHWTAGQVGARGRWCGVGGGDCCIRAAPSATRYPREPLEVAPALPLPLATQGDPLSLLGGQGRDILRVDTPEEGGGAAPKPRRPLCALAPRARPSPQEPGVSGSEILTSGRLGPSDPLGKPMIRLG